MPDHSSRTSDSYAAAAMRSFYTKVLGGREVWTADAGDGLSRHCFFIGGRLVETSIYEGDSLPPLLVEVDEPDKVAERCWDAGFTVQVHADTAERSMLSVVDPIGRRIDLVPRATRFAS